MTDNDYPNVLFILIDSLRADYLYGENKTVETPNIDSLMNSGVYFENAISSTDITGYSLKSIFSGCFPFGCGISKDTFEKIYSEKSSFLTSMKNNGYHIYGHMGKAIFNQGFKQVFENDDVTATNSVHKGLGKKIIEKITSSSLTKPWFYYIHPMDVHIPCDVPDKYKELSLEERYNFNISSIDSLIGKIMEKINLSNTIIVLTADHGDYIDPFDTYRGIQDKSNFLSKTMKKSVKKIIPKSLHKSVHDQKKSIQNQIRSTSFNTPHEKRNLEGRGNKHRMLFDDLVHVPLLISGFGIKHSKPISMQVGLVDIFPTIFEKIGINHQNKINGRSLLPLISKKEFVPEPIYMENALLIKSTTKNSTSCVGIRTNKFKYFRDLHNPKKNVNLYDLENDPLEDHNIAQNNLEQIDEFEKNILKLKNNSMSDKKLEELSPEELEETEKELKKMGYI